MLYLIRIYVCTGICDEIGVFYSFEDYEVKLLIYCSSENHQNHTNLLAPNQGKTMGHLEHSDDQKHLWVWQPWNDKKIQVDRGPL